MSGPSGEEFIKCVRILFMQALPYFGHQRRNALASKIRIDEQKLIYQLYFKFIHFTWK